LRVRGGAELFCERPAQRDSWAFSFARIAARKAALVDHFQS
jgi:hypothetical protein